MQLYIQIDSNTVFKSGDIVADKNEVCASCDGDRSSFRSHPKMVLRPVAADEAIMQQKAMLASKLRAMADSLCPNGGDMPRIPAQPR